MPIDGLVGGGGGGGGGKYIYLTMTLDTSIFKVGAGSSNGVIAAVYQGSL